MIPMTDVYFSLTSHVHDGLAAAALHPYESGTQADEPTSTCGAHGRPHQFHSHSANPVAKPPKWGRVYTKKHEVVFEQ